MLAGVTVGWDVIFALPCGLVGAFWYWWQLHTRDLRIRELERDNTYLRSELDKIEQVYSRNDSALPL